MRGVGSERVADTEGGREESVVGGGVDHAGGASAFAAELDGLQVDRGPELNGPGSGETGDEVEARAVAEEAVGVAGVGGVLADEEGEGEVAAGTQPDAVVEQHPLQASLGLRAGDRAVDQQRRNLGLDGLAEPPRAETEVRSAGGGAGSEVMPEPGAESDLVQVVLEGPGVVRQVELDAGAHVEREMQAERFLRPDLDAHGHDRERRDCGVDRSGRVTEFEAPVDHPQPGPGARANAAPLDHGGAVRREGRQRDDEEKQAAHGASVSRMWAACIGVALVLGSAGPVEAKTPTLAERQMELAVQKHLSIYLTTRSRREASERVVLEGDRLEVWFMRPLPRSKRGDFLCDGFRWLIRGRLAGSTGIRALFAALPEIENVTLVFYELETKVEPDAQGHYTQLRNASARARYTVSRQRANMVDPVAAARALNGAGCAARGEALVDGFWAAPEAGG